MVGFVGVGARSLVQLDPKGDGPEVYLLYSGELWRGIAPGVIEHVDGAAEVVGFNGRRGWSFGSSVNLMVVVAIGPSGFTIHRTVASGNEWVSDVNSTKMPILERIVDDMYAIDDDSHAIFRTVDGGTIWNQIVDPAADPHGNYTEIHLIPNFIYIQAEPDHA
jgi:hypothetical protein